MCGKALPTHPPGSRGSEQKRFDEYRGLHLIAAVVVRLHTLFRITDHSTTLSLPLFLCGVREHYPIHAGVDGGESQVRKRYYNGTAEEGIG